MGVLHVFITVHAACSILKRLSRVARMLHLPVLMGRHRRAAKLVGPKPAKDKGKDTDTDTDTDTGEGECG